MGAFFFARRCSGRRSSSISPSSGPSRSVRDVEFCNQIATSHADNYGVYGVRKALSRSAARAAELQTTNPAPETGRAMDLVNRQFAATLPNELWGADFADVRTFPGCVCVTCVRDACSHMIIAWQVSTKPGMWQERPDLQFGFPILRIVRAVPSRVHAPRTRVAMSVLLRRSRAHP